MGTSVPPTDNQADENASFGSGLGADFKPLGKRITVKMARDAKPLKTRLQSTGNPISPRKP
ncbi:hypothetical protein [Rhizobium sp. X9]|uniref:hypothetical protein n=1 Tax=Rhizobium sp. X9 TaxID=2815360 RepID=UPI001C0B638F|nr:hypothetical protein [Rhizobium sp. X9]